MQTQCPHCDTRFRVTENQVNIADGFVRCSVCKEIFNAFEVAEQHDHQPSLLSQENSKNEPAIPEFDNDTYEDTNAELSDEHSSNIDNPQAVEAVDFNQASATDDSLKDAFDFFDEEANESLSHVVPDQYKDSYSSSSPTLVSNLLWSAGILLLTATLLVEYTWFNRDQLNQIPQMQMLSDKLCQHIECRNITMRNPKNIELIARNVYSHPNEKNALMVNLTMKNNADFAQPFPVMQISFSDVRGGSVAARRFLPAEYLPEEIQQSGLQLLESDTNITFTMEIQDPGKQAMTYEFDFL